MNRITDKQRSVLAFICKFIDEHGYPPTQREICKAFKWSGTQAAVDHVVALEKKGFLRRDPKVSRGLRVIRYRFAEGM